jgi:hypothetical protein
MRVKEELLMRKKDWIFSGVSLFILICMIASNIWLIILFLSMKISQIILYVTSILVVLVIMTYYHVRDKRTGHIEKQSWIINHLLFWLMTDLHTLIILARYILPNERQGGLLPELFFLAHLLLIFPVLFSERSTFYQKHELAFSILLHIITYSLLSYSFVQLVIQTMQ